MAGTIMWGRHAFIQASAGSADNSQTIHLWKFVAGHSVFRPFFLRALITMRPLGVRILALKPLVLVRALQRTLSWLPPTPPLELLSCIIGLPEWPRHIFGCSCCLTSWCPAW